jgi:hypothetical protein
VKRGAQFWPLAPQLDFWRARVPNWSPTKGLLPSKLKALKEQPFFVHHIESFAGNEQTHPSGENENGPLERYSLI